MNNYANKIVNLNKIAFTKPKARTEKQKEKEKKKSSRPQI